MCVVEERKQVQVHKDVSVKRGEDIRSEYLLLRGSYKERGGIDLLEW